MIGIHKKLSDIRSDILKISEYIEDYITDYSVIKTMENIKGQIPQSKDNIKQVKILSSILKNYKEYLNTIGSTEYINILKNHSSDTYTDSYVKNLKKILKELSEVSKEIDEGSSEILSSLNIEDIDIESLDSTLSSVTSLIDKYKKNDRHKDVYKVMELAKDKLLGYKKHTIKNIYDKYPVLHMGLEFNLKPDNKNFYTMSEINKVKDTTKILINNNIPNSDSYVIYDFDKILSNDLSNIKKLSGINRQMIQKLNTIRYEIKSKNIDKYGIDIKQGKHNIRIYESIDGTNYRALLYNNNQDIQDKTFTNIIKGPKARIHLYNKLTDEVINSKDTVKLHNPFETPASEYTSLKDYKGKTENDIFTKNEDPELSLLNLWDAYTIKKELFKLRDVKDPKVQLPFFVLRKL